MSYKFKKVYICDCCGTIALPEKVIAMGDSYKSIPVGWTSFRSEHYCHKCSVKIRAIEKALHAEEKADD